jgi:tetratricopeptide (TPR) repeat protein
MKKERLLLGLLLGAVVLVYANTLVNQFAMDDELYIARNAQVTDPSLHRLFSPNAVSAVFRPVSFATLALNWALGGADPVGYHLLNLLLHAAATWLLYILLQDLLSDMLEGKTIAFAAALIYAVHPIHTEAVAWAVGRAELLAAGFLFAGWILHLRDRPVTSLACFALALLSKESAVAFLPLVLLGDYALCKWKPRVRYAQAAALTVLYLGILWKVQGGRFGPAEIPMVDNPLAHLPAGWRILNALRVVWKYVALQVYPAVFSCDYSFNQIPVYRDLHHTLPAALAAAAAGGAWLWAVSKRHAGAILAGGIYLGGFAATANILVPTGTIMGERLAYLSSAGFCLLVALGWNWLRERKEILAWVLLAAVVLALSVRTTLRNRDWKDAFTLYSSAVVAVPNDAKMHANLAGRYFARNQLDLAAREYQIALRINPDSPDALASYASLEFQRGQYQSAGTMMERALSMSGRNNLNYDFMVVTFAAILMKTNHADGALEYLNREIGEAPAFAPAWTERAELHYQQREFAPARSDAVQALRLNPGDPQTQDILRRLDALTSAANSH